MYCVLGSHPSANDVYGFSQSYQQGGGRFTRGRGRRGRNGPFRNNTNKPKCQLCWKTGHVALKCYKRFDVNFAGPDYAANGSVNDYPQTHISVSGSSPSVDPNWYFDSGVTAHVTAEMDNLSLKSAYQGSDKLVVGNGSKLPISHIGLSHLPCVSSSSSSPSLLLNNILYV
ncbi:hypothetical protein DH2020_026774 [Rehmannia glutinosa]|uniref:Uncharacterized protein n=1 Tax=Rehmannia glutinosa TaxID=99300 RepID=A0ABR0W0E0_REHGL